MESDSKQLSAPQVAAAAAALAEHLQRVGVGVLPAANPDSVAKLVPRFVASSAAGESTGSVDANAGQIPAPVSRSPGPANPPRRQPVAATRQSDLLVESSEENYPGAEVPTAERQGQLEVIAGQVSACVRCDVLADCRTQTVFGEGSVRPRVAFFGEGPGADEDRTGRPFVGKAGQLLTKMIEACSFQREDVYILNTVKCRPPGNRNPEPEEIENCREYFEQQLAILRPEYIVCLGAVGSQALLRSKLSVGRLRGKIHRYFDSKVIVTYHPAYLLRTPQAKKAAWQDLQLMLRDAGIEVSR